MIYTTITVASNTGREGTVMAKYDVAIRGGRVVSETAPIAGFDQGKGFSPQKPKGVSWGHWVPVYPPIEKIACAPLPTRQETIRANAAPGEVASWYSNFWEELLQSSHCRW